MKGLYAERKNETDLSHPLTSPVIQLANYEFSKQSQPPPQPPPPPQKKKNETNKTCLIAEVTKEKVISLSVSKISLAKCFSPFAGPSS